MRPCRWVFVVASCLAWVAGQEDSAKPTRAKNITKLVSAELHPNGEGSLERRCVVLTFPDVVPRRPQTSSKPGQPTLANTALPEPSCPPPETPTQVYDSESLFVGVSPNVSLLREQSKNYLVAYNRERSFSKAQVLGMVLAAMMAEERIDVGLELLRSQIQLGGTEEPEIMVVCLPDGSKEGRVINDCVDGMGSTSPSRDTQQNEKREIKTVKDTVEGNKSKSPEVIQTYLPPRHPPTITSPEVPARSNPPTAQSQPVTKNDRQLPTADQSAPLIQLSVSGVIRAMFPLSVSKMTAQLSLSLAPSVAQTSFLLPSTPKPNTSKLPLRPSTKVTTPTDILPQTPAVFTPVPQPETPSTVAVAPATTSSPITPSVLLNTSSPSPLVDSTTYHPPTTGSSSTPTDSSEFSTQANTTLSSSEPLY